MADRTRDASAAAPPVEGGGIGGIEIAAGLATLVWLGAAAVMALAADPAEGMASRLMTVVAVVLPLALIWLATVTARSARALRSEAARLQASIDTLRATSLAQAQGGVRAAPGDLAQRLDTLIAAQRKTESALASLALPPEAPGTPTPPELPDPPEAKPALAAPPPPAPDRQPTLALGPAADRVPDPVTVADLLRALNFPESGEDRAGFRALRLALADPRAARMIRAAQDVLTLLSEDGIYMDDLAPEPTPPELWRRFARGARGAEVAGVGAIHAPEALALATARMREDAVFRDVAHHFLRHFDRLLEEFEKNAEDDDLAVLAETRSARAFMLLGRVTGIFG